MTKLKPLSQQVVVVTGASSGIGLATARKAAKAGAKVLLVARGEPALKAAVEDIIASGGRAAYAVADVGELSELEQAAHLALERFGGIDTWVSNAGVAIYADVLTTPRDEHERLFRTNYWGAVNSAQVAIPHLRARRGAFIMVGSVASDMGSPVMGTYAASKHAVKGYVDSLRIELNRDKVPVIVTLVKPSGIGTPLNAHVANHKHGEAKVPPPVYAPELVADAILHAARHPMREVTVGGAGLAQVLFATHFPGLFAHLAGAITPLLNDPKTPATPGDNLFSAMSGGEVHGAEGPGLRFSLYTAAGCIPSRPRRPWPQAPL
ncbi:SDR family oxidoreductase [Caulobacter sp. S45]|uniref:SDR family oxidoreductase n=1 Tax=Caulobacter sp. S45 TaxID=1641861 RepID=UPI001575EB03|nr:SDR family oxidoreductase [Caulobacter sp. S45]